MRWKLWGSLAQDDTSPEFLEAIRVFDGELTCCRLGHPDGMACDREGLVMPMLGLYAQLFQDRESEQGKLVFNVIDGKQGTLFPADFTFVEGGVKTRRRLFGDLVQAVEAAVASEGGLAFDAMSLDASLDRDGSSQKSEVEHEISDASVELPNASRPSPLKLFGLQL